MKTGQVPMNYKVDVVRVVVPTLLYLNERRDPNTNRKLEFGPQNLPFILEEMQVFPGLSHDWDLLKYPFFNNQTGHVCYFTTGNIYYMSSTRKKFFFLFG